MGLRVIIALTGVERGSRPSDVTYTFCSDNIYTIMYKTHPISKIFGGENATKTFFLVNDQDTICSLRGAELTSIGYAYSLWNSQCRARLEGSDGAFNNWRFTAFLTSKTASGGDGTFTRKL